MPNFGWKCFIGSFLFSLAAVFASTKVYLLLPIEHQNPVEKPAFEDIETKNIDLFADNEESNPIVEKFNEINNNGQLDMSPSYQRNAVWTNRQKSYLIDTILNGYPIPEIYIQEDIDEAGHAMFIIVDGQQRLRAVLDFLDN